MMSIIVYIYIYRMYLEQHDSGRADGEGVVLCSRIVESGIYGTTTLYNNDNTVVPDRHTILCL